jgi:hypothetical protein
MNKRNFLIILSLLIFSGIVSGIFLFANSTRAQLEPAICCKMTSKIKYLSWIFNHTAYFWARPDHCSGTTTNDHGLFSTEITFTEVSSNQCAPRTSTPRTSSRVSYNRGENAIYNSSKDRSQQRLGPYDSQQIFNAGRQRTMYDAQPSYLDRTRSSGQ